MYDIAETDNLEEKLEAVPFHCADFPAPPEFTKLPNENWIEDDFSLVTESQVTNYLYLKAKQGYTKNFRTGIHLCQCGHVFSLSNFVFIKAKCRPTMRQVPPFYSLFIMLDNKSTPIDGNCKCPAGESQSCVHCCTAYNTLRSYSSGMHKYEVCLVKAYYSRWESMHAWLLV